MIAFVRKRSVFLILLSLFVFGIWLRVENIKGNNLVLDYDQIEDQFYTYQIAVDHNISIIGRAIYGDPRIHHGVFYYYYNLIPYLLSGGNFFASAYWNIFFNTLTSIIVFFLAKSLFNKNLPALISAFISVCSFQMIKFSNWLTIDTISIFLIPLFFLGLWQITKEKKWGYILAPLSLGLGIQSDISLAYLIPITAIFWIIFKPKLSSLKMPLLSILIFLLSTSTLILTEIKLKFVGINTLLHFSNTFGSATGLPINERFYLFSQDVFENFSNNLIPQRPDLGIYLAVALILLAIYKTNRKGVIFILLYLLSPAITLLLGYHDKEWFLIGLSPAIAIISGLAISKLKIFLIIPILFMIGFYNTTFVLDRPKDAFQLIDTSYDSTSYLAYQLQVVDFVYQNSGGKPFAINAVTFPLYYNGLWSYLFSWYGKEKYGFMPTWLGGEQLPPYDRLPKSKGTEKIFFMLMSVTPRIPEYFRTDGEIWAMDKGKLIEEKVIGGFRVLKYEKP